MSSVLASRVDDKAPVSRSQTLGGTVTLSTTSVAKRSAKTMPQKGVGIYNGATAKLIIEAGGCDEEHTGNIFPA
jgi:hypothetical protein